MIINKNRAYSKLGYHKDRDGLLNRYFRESANWQSHLDNTHKAIIDFSQGKQNGSCVVFGSGWWLDIPIDFLQKHFREVHLIDISHPMQIQKKAEKLPNVNLTTLDISGVMKPIWEYTSKHRKKSEFNKIIEIISSANPIADTPFADADYFISANMMSQLNVFISPHLAKRTNLAEGEVRQIQDLIHKKHLEFLPKGKSCLVTDYREICTPKGTSSAITRDLINIEFPKPAEMRKWKWHFDLNGNYKNCKTTIFKVIALDL